jgi:hypothetical protein
MRARKYIRTHTHIFIVDSFTQRVLHFASICLYPYRARICMQIHIYGPLSWGEIVRCAVMWLTNLGVSHGWKKVAQRCVSVTDTQRNTALLPLQQVWGYDAVYLHSLLRSQLFVKQAPRRFQRRREAIKQTHQPTIFDTAVPNTRTIFRLVNCWHQSSQRC